MGHILAPVNAQSTILRPARPIEAAANTLCEAEGWLKKANNPRRDRQDLFHNAAAQGFR